MSVKIGNKISEVQQTNDFLEQKYFNYCFLAYLHSEDFVMEPRVEVSQLVTYTKDVTKVLPCVGRSW